jgi:UPF0755 protein
VSRGRIRWGRLIAMLLALGLVLGGCTAVLTNFLGDAPQEPTGPVTVVVEEGMGAGGVADLLAEKGVITNALSFKLRARVDDRSSQIRPGTYEFEPGASYEEIVTAMTQAPSEAPTFKVTIPEGLTVDQSLQRIADAKGSPFSAKQLRTALAGVAVPAWVPTELPEGASPFEGILFPSTYDFLRDSTAPDLLSKLVEQTEIVMDRANVPPAQRYETLIKASLIEREARVREEQPVIASVIENRVDQGMRLQIDATVVYAKYRVTGEIVNSVLTSDLELDSPWNTYLIDGLPPTPISGSGESAIQAAANPDSTNFLFYVVSNRETGEHAFAATLDEHNANVARYRELREQEESG